MLRHLLSGLRPGSIPGGSTWTMNYESGFGRLSSITGGAFNQQYNYRTTSDGKKTNQITSISYSGITYPNSDDTRTYTYTYDANGNITSAQFGIRTVTYEYDSQNQLIKETNEKLGRDFTYTYDNAGNILTETTYVYPTTSTGSGSTSTVSFAYDSGWGDLLNSYGNGTVTRQVTHDEIGNRLSDVIRTYTWRNGRELATVTRNGVTWTNTYNANGMRTKRTDGTNTYEYIYNGDKLMQMKKNGEVINFTYIGNTPATMTYQGSTFYYVVNAQGDVTGMTNSAGKLVVSYTYDAWGRWIYYIQDAEWSNVLGGINPLLYRGYVYDHETGLYYLQSRYYDYNTHRFLNADALTATGQGLLGNNMFTYCFNNPVCLSDPSGYKPCVPTAVAFGERTKDEQTQNLRDVTEEIESALNNAIVEARTYKAVHKILFGDELIGSGVTYLYFYGLVDHYARWDIKRPDPWKETIGTDYPGYDVEVICGGMIMTPENLGNFTYGFLGYVYDIPLEHLIPGSWYAAGFPTEGADLGNEVYDWIFISIGYECAKTTYPEGV